MGWFSRKNCVCLRFEDTVFDYIGSLSGVRPFGLLEVGSVNS